MPRPPGAKNEHLTFSFFRNSSLCQPHRQRAPEGHAPPRSIRCTVGPSRFVNHLNCENLAFSQIVTLRVTPMTPVPQKFRKRLEGRFCNPFVSPREKSICSIWRNPSRDYGVTVLWVGDFCGEGDREVFGVLFGGGRRFRSDDPLQPISSHVRRRPSKYGIENIFNVQIFLLLQKFDATTDER
jgi:hypothetical protein